ncbi:hypothetical protein SAMN05660657_02038 [Geodermatophilus amargosae]|uniref:NPCBM/NEW2 domain-containing protein n=1 Tax=Geodermatophilus amargosae TaxID=1296565 RepID=A0A1I6ZJU9_9ACTN|nr:hypothetical protein SAMN05660657_02038 [Geodermatophilus amargosae]
MPYSLAGSTGLTGAHVTGRIGFIRTLGAALAATGVAATGACGGGTSSFAADTSSPAPTTTEEPAASTTAATTTASTTTPSTASTTGATSTTGGPLGTDDAGRRLTLRDFFSPASSWEEQRYDVAGQQDVQGIANEVSTCYGANAEDGLELRLGNNFDTLEFSVAQADDSRSSDQELTVQVLANNEQVEVRNVPFNQVQDFSIPVTGVNALKIQLALDDRDPDCSGAVTAVLTDAEVS